MDNINELFEPKQIQGIKKWHAPELTAYQADLAQGGGNPDTDGYDTGKPS
jgi:hypothetical protein